MANAPGDADVRAGEVAGAALSRADYSGDVFALGGFFAEE